MLTAQVTVTDEKGAVLSETTVDCETYQEERRKGPLRYIFTLFVENPEPNEKPESVQGGT